MGTISSLMFGKSDTLVVLLSEAIAVSGRICTLDCASGSI